MKMLEQAPRQRPSLLEPTKLEVFESLMERDRRREQEGREPTAEEQLEYLHAMRGALYEKLLDLERLRTRRQDVKPEEFETLKFMIREGYLKGRGKDDALIMLRMPDELTDTALSEIALLAEVDADIAATEADAGFPDEEIKQRAASHAQHLNAIRADWDVQ